ncbi:MAG: NADH-quinone oxidoreductase subunit J [Verrucomicrobia bacterium]|nr:NADH-quinone oxidoreductase subunit J [Verrucomicrobiota bacterium]MDA1067543.1 NADH-quinone oxidoreductase subunit J [Verrucomicrobiota bacterium]
MVDFLFYLFALITLLGAASVVFSNNPVNAAMLLIVSFVGTASLFILLGAYFLAAVQLAVYAGAVIVLFLFIIMLLNVDAATKVRPNYITIAAGAIAGLLMILGVLKLFKRGDNFTMATLGEVEPVGATTRLFGEELFTTYMLPFQVAGILLLIAMLGVIFISKRTAAARKGTV